MTPAYYLKSLPDPARGWAPMDCGCCAYVFGAALSARVDLSAFRPCPKDPLVSAVDITHVRALEAQ